MLYLHAQRHGSLPLTIKNSIIFPFRGQLSSFFRTFAPDSWSRSTPLSYCSCIRAPAVLFVKLKLTRFCLVCLNLENSKNEQGRVRRFTYIRGLVVSCSPHKVFPEPRHRDVGSACPRFFFPFPKRQSKDNPSMLAERLSLVHGHLKIDRCFNKIIRSGDLRRPPLLSYYPFGI